MHIDIRPFLVLWGCLAVAVIALIAWRRSVSRDEDASLHVLQTSPAHQQVAVAHRLDVIDKWGKILTVITFVFGLLLAAVYVYQSWISASNIPTGA